MRTHPRSIVTVGAGLAAVLIAVTSGTPSAAAATPDYASTTNAVQAAAGWLAGQFENGSHLPAPDGDHFDSKYGSSYYPNYGENADAIFGLAAAKSGGAKITTALDYLKTNLDAYTDIPNKDGYGPYDGSVAKTAVAALVAGADPTDFAGQNLLQVLKKDECAAGSTTCTPGSAANIYASVSESLAVLAEARGAATYGKKYAPSTAAVDYLLSLQCASGGFTVNTTPCGKGAADVDSTSYALMALQALGGQSAAAGKAADWLAGQRASGGYWVVQGTPNTNSTGLAAAALQGQGHDVSTSRAWLRSQQVAPGSAGAGALKYAGAVQPSTTSATSPAVLATAQGLTGLVDGGSLAVLSASGSTSAVTVYAPTAGIATTSVAQGGTQTVSATGFAPRERVQVTLHSTPVVVATVVADALGTVHASYTVPASLAAGSHEVLLTGLSSGLVARRAFTVTARTSTGAGSSASSGILADTGLDTARLAALALAGALAVLLGTALTVAGRRRVR